MILRLIGKGFIATGVVILLFLAYQLFGTNFVAESAQRTLQAEVGHQMEPGATPTPGPPGSTPSSTVVPRPPEAGKGIARITIPKIGVDWIVVEGVSVDDLKKGPGHFPGTALPGQHGNVVISGHRTTYGAPFFRINELVEGDVINITTIDENYVYKVTGIKIVAPTDLTVVTPTTDARLTLTTCNPRFSAAQRLIVYADLVPEATTEKAA